jgi:hypothetical protein
MRAPWMHGRVVRSPAHLHLAKLPPPHRERPVGQLLRLLPAEALHGPTIIIIIIIDEHGGLVLVERLGGALILGEGLYDGLVGGEQVDLVLGERLQAGGPLPLLAPPVPLVREPLGGQALLLLLLLRLHLLTDNRSIGT